MSLLLVVPASAQQGDSGLPPGWQVDTPPTVPSPPPPPQPVERTDDTAPTAPAELPVGWAEVATPITPFIPAAGSGPLIRCTWQLPDMDTTEPEMQYEGSGGANDDDPSVGSTRRCGPESVGSDAQHTVQLRGPSNGQPRTLELWAAVEHPDGPGAIQAATWKVFYPDGQLKEEVEGIAIEPSECRDLADTMLAAAADSDQVEAIMVEDPDAGLAASCDQGVTALLSAQVGLAKSEPCGEYRVEFRADDGRMSSVQVAYFDVQCYVEIELGFDFVDFGEAQAAEQGGGGPSGRSFVTVGRNTVRNAGSGGLNLGIEFAEMVPVDPETEQVLPGPGIDLFGATLAVGHRPPQTHDIMPAGDTVWFASDDDRTLCSGEVATLEMWIAQESIPPGEYRGHLTITARPDEADSSGTYTCHNDNGVWDARSQR